MALRYRARVRYTVGRETENSSAKSLIEYPPESCIRRFPIQIDLESSDIKEICYRRLLGKSPAGETELGKLRQRIEEERSKIGEKGPVKFSKSIVVPIKVTSAADIDSLIQQLHEVKAQLSLYEEIEVSFVFGKPQELDLT